MHVDASEYSAETASLLVSGRKSRRTGKASPSRAKSPAWNTEIAGRLLFEKRQVTVRLAASRSAIRVNERRGRLYGTKAGDPKRTLKSLHLAEISLVDDPSRIAQSEGDRGEAPDRLARRALKTLLQQALACPARSAPARSPPAALPRSAAVRPATLSARPP